MIYAVEIASLGRLIETGLIRQSARNSHLIRRFETARWIEPSGRKNEWRVRHGKRDALIERIDTIYPNWRDNFEFIRHVGCDPYDPVAIQAVNLLRKQKDIRGGMLNRRNWNAAFGIGPKNEPRIAAMVPLTKDWVLRFRPSSGLRGRFVSGEVDFHEMASRMTECIIPERMWMQFKGFLGELPGLVMTCENLGVYIDLPAPENMMVVYSPGADIESAASLVRWIPYHVRWVHFGDIDPDGIEIGERLARAIGRKLDMYIPSFAEEYLPGQPAETSWKSVPDSSLSLFAELKRTQKRIFQESFMLDPRLAEEIRQLCLKSSEN